MNQANELGTEKPKTPSKLVTSPLGTKTVAKGQREKNREETRAGDLNDDNDNDGDDEEGEEEDERNEKIKRKKTITSATTAMAADLAKITTAKKKKRGRPIGWRKDKDQKGFSNKYKGMEKSANYAKKAQLQQNQKQNNNTTKGGNHKRMYYSDDDNDEYDSDDDDGQREQAFNKYNTRGSDDDDDDDQDRRNGKPSSSEQKQQQYKKPKVSAAATRGKQGVGRPKKNIDQDQFARDKYQQGMLEAQAALDRNMHNQEKSDKAFDRAESRKYLMLSDRFENLQKKYDDLKRKKVDEVALHMQKYQESVKEKERAQDVVMNDLRRDREFFRQEANKTLVLAEEKGNMKVEMFKLQEELVQKGQEMLNLQKMNRKLRDDLKIALTSTEVGQSFGPPQLEALSGLRWKKLQSGKHQFTHMLTGFTFTLEAGEDPKTHAINGEDPLNMTLLDDRVATHTLYTPTNLGIIEAEKLEPMLREEMEFLTKHLSSFFTKFLDGIMTCCVESGIIDQSGGADDDNDDVDDDDGDDVDANDDGATLR